MTNFAVIKNNIVENIIVAESKDIAEEVTGLLCIEYTESDTPHIGLGYVDGVFEKPAPKAAPTEIPTE